MIFRTYFAKLYSEFWFSRFCKVHVTNNANWEKRRNTISAPNSGNAQRHVEMESYPCVSTHFGFSTLDNVLIRRTISQFSFFFFSALSTRDVCRLKGYTFISTGLVNSIMQVIHHKSLSIGSLHRVICARKHARTWLQISPLLPHSRWRIYF